MIRTLKGCGYHGRGNGTFMKKIAIIGVGLIGGSLGMALRRHQKKYFVTGIGRNEGKLNAALRSGAIDEATTDMGCGVAEADVVVICTPVDTIADTVRQILPLVKPGAIITDAGSVKVSVITEVKKVFARFSGKRSSLPVFIGGHPMAGCEKNGIDHASPGLYTGATVVLTPAAAASTAAGRAVSRLWQDAGASVVFMDEGRHDRIVAATSHLPHCLAFSLCRIAARAPGAEKLLAGSFRDATRVAGSNSRDWAVICAANRKEVGRAIDAMVKELTAIRRSLAGTNTLAARLAAGAADRVRLMRK